MKDHIKRFTKNALKIRRDFGVPLSLMKMVITCLPLKAGEHADLAVLDFPKAKVYCKHYISKMNNRKYYIEKLIRLSLSRFLIFLNLIEVNSG